MIVLFTVFGCKEREYSFSTIKQNINKLLPADDCKTVIKSLLLPLNSTG